MPSIHDQIKKTIAKKIDAEVSDFEFADVPADISGDYALPCFPFAKEKGLPPQKIAADIAELITDMKGISSAHAAGSYVNITLDEQFVLSHILKTGKIHRGTKRKTVVLDYSSPNIAKPFGVGHLRSTFVGEALKRIHAWVGYRTVAVNHLGDWGTQFGKLIVAYKKWPRALSKKPIRTLYELYVRFHSEAEKNPELEEEARNWFKKLEEDDHEARKLWKLFRDVSLKEFKQLYKLLGISFDSYDGEAFYNDKLKNVEHLLEKKKLFTESQGAYIVDLSSFDLPPGLIRKSDGASLYLTRDIAAALHRFKRYHFSKMIYEVGMEQQLHFRQLFAILELMEYDWASACIHVSHGHYTVDGKKMSTRKGTVLFVEDLIVDVETAVLKVIKEKNKYLKNKKGAAHTIALAAIIYNDLRVDREQSSDFNIERMIDFQGETGPYLLYTYARLKSILRKGRTAPHMTQTHIKKLGEAERLCIIELARFEEIITQTIVALRPDILAKYLMSLAKKLNAYYTHHRVLQHDKTVQCARLAFILFAARRFKEGLSLLNIATLEEM